MTYEEKLKETLTAALGLTGVRGVRETWGDTEVFKPYGMATILFIDFDDGES